MPLLRLIGLALFITAILLALAAAITKTTHIRMQAPGRVAQEQSDPTSVLPPPMGSGIGSEVPQGNPDAMHFQSVPVVWPLLIAAGTGLLMWFMLPGETRRSKTYSNRRSRRRK